jgi:hypothetical protein
VLKLPLPLTLTCTIQTSPCSLGLSATSQQYFSLTTNQPPATSQQYFSLRTNQHQPSATSQPNRLHGQYHDTAAMDVVKHKPMTPALFTNHQLTTDRPSSRALFRQYHDRIEPAVSKIYIVAGWIPFSKQKMEGVANPLILFTSPLIT